MCECVLNLFDSDIAMKRLLYKLSWLICTHLSEEKNIMVMQQSYLEAIYIYIYFDLSKLLVINIGTFSFGDINTRTCSWLVKF